MTLAVAEVLRPHQTKPTVLIMRVNIEEDNVCLFVEAPTTPAPSTPVPSTRPCIDAEFFCGYYTDAGSQKAECIPLTWSCDKDQDCKKSVGFCISLVY